MTFPRSKFVTSLSSFIGKLNFHLLDLKFELFSLRHVTFEVLQSFSWDLRSKKQILIFISKRKSKSVWFRISVSLMSNVNMMICNNSKTNRQGIASIKTVSVIVWFAWGNSLDFSKNLLIRLVSLASCGNHFILMIRAELCKLSLNAFNLRWVHRRVQVTRLLKISFAGRHRWLVFWSFAPVTSAQFPVNGSGVLPS